MTLHSYGCDACCFLIKDWTRFVLLIKDRIWNFIQTYPSVKTWALMVDSPVALPQKPVETKQDYSEAPVAKRFTFGFLVDEQGWLSYWCTCGCSLLCGLLTSLRAFINPFSKSSQISWISN
ncbi:hypothetical protein Rs2_46833 [Raphanus sativus]|nr:hypothetical protein Rs2_46833 [Raphanus sativus]